MKIVVIAGASGVVGARALHHLSTRDDVGRVVALGRRLLDARDEKIVSKVVDLQSAAAMKLEIPEQVDVAICCLGTTMKKAGSKEAFRAVDRDAVLAFAEAARARGAKRFVIVTALGARARSRNFYLATKGEVEEALERLGFAQLSILRPSLLDDEGARTEHRLGERVALPIARALFSLLGKTSRYAPISADVVGRALVQVALDETSERVRRIEGPALHALGGPTRPGAYSHG